jgi:phycocyanobilin:ferredoxin oxidoreductase
MTHLTDIVRDIADSFEQVIHTHSTNLQLMPTEDYGWSNKRWFSSQFRLAHMERFEQPKFSVLHMVIWPHVTDPSEIFGFDVIASDKLVTGLFWDLSPTILPSKRFCEETFSEPRELPSWGTIFSEHWVACRPNKAELLRIGELATTCLVTHIQQLGTRSTHEVGRVIQAHNNYSLQQRQNEHTTRVILKLLGPERGSQFINQILFPTV